jgi:hypothetical protein
MRQRRVDVQHRCALDQPLGEVVVGHLHGVVVVGGAQDYQPSRGAAICQP